MQTYKRIPKSPLKAFIKKNWVQSIEVKSCQTPKKIRPKELRFSSKASKKDINKFEKNDLRA